jgi:hypothetical protein
MAVFYQIVRRKPSSFARRRTFGLTGLFRVYQNISGLGNVRLPAEGADRTVMNGRGAIRAALLQNFTANGAELAADRIAMGAVGLVICATFHMVGVVARAMRIGAKAFPRLYRESRRRRFGRRGFLFNKRNPELFGQFGDDFIVQLAPIALFEHRKRRLFTTDLQRKRTLRNRESAPCISYFSANLRIEVDHRRYYGLYFINPQAPFYKQLSTGLSTY